MKNVVFASTVALTAAFLALGAYAKDKPAPDNWGQEVKKCNQENCYPGGTNRGAYVSGQAKDEEGPGYAEEIHKYAKPGKSDPKKFRD
jgi:hypothetical protein